MRWAALVAALTLLTAASCEERGESTRVPTGASPMPGVSERPGAEPEGAHGHTGEGQLAPTE